MACMQCNFKTKSHYLIFMADAKRSRCELGLSIADCNLSDPLCLRFCSSRRWNRIFPRALTAAVFFLLSAICFSLTYGVCVSCMARTGSVPFSIAAVSTALWLHAVCDRQFATVRNFITAHIITRNRPDNESVHRPKPAFLNRRWLHSAICMALEKSKMVVFTSTITRKNGNDIGYPLIKLIGNILSNQTWAVGGGVGGGY